MDLEFEKTQIKELKGVIEIYSEAQAFMEANGNPQWPKGFPDVTDLQEAIYGGILYSVHSHGDLVAVFSAVTSDNNYDEIDGAWLTTGHRYLAVHRVAVREDMRGNGIAKYIIKAAAPDLARSLGKTSIRMDTHEKNIPMRHLLKECGFTECGKVSLIRDDSIRLAYEKVLNPQE
ncbi:MAG: GNAT family N-acetyltransferase [Clostridia bacterium]|nr:GNAT family N-acetyltransferase [Clostridia bacterium]